MLAGLRLLRLQQTHYTHWLSSDEPSPVVPLVAMFPHGVALGSWLAHLHPAPPVGGASYQNTQELV